tara:strand:- start:136 stop:627 length:492 start_codon:yes stop_codon:yes gene_type:complete
MLIGVVSDTHNNLKNINLLISVFNDKSVDLVVHTGDISKASTLNEFSKLNSKLIGVYGNNDQNEPGLEEVAIKNGFLFKQPPFKISEENRNIVIFHEPDFIDEFLNKNTDIDIVLHGHTHRYREENINKTLIFNPGESAGMLQGKNAVGIINLKNFSVERIFF